MDDNKNEDTFNPSRDTLHYPEWEVKTHRPKFLANVNSERRFFINLELDVNDICVPIESNDNAHKDGGDVISNGVFLRSNRTSTGLVKRETVETVVEKTKSTETVTFLTHKHGLRLAIHFNDKNAYIGEGRFSIVYKGELFGRDSLSNTTVAIKFSRNDTESIECNERETLALKCLYETLCSEGLEADIYIIKLLDTINTGLSVLPFKAYSGTIFEYHGLGNLFQIILNKEQDKKIEMSLSVLRKWGYQLFMGLGAIEKARIIHHDIKPHNIILAADLSLRIADFGASRILPPGLDVLPLGEGRGLGTLMYTAQELLNFRIDGVYDKSIDVYSGGVVLYVMLTGREPFKDGPLSPSEQIIAACKGFFESGYNPINTLPDGSVLITYGKSSFPVGKAHVTSMIELITQCTNKDPKQRPLPLEVAEFFASLMLE